MSEQTKVDVLAVMDAASATFDNIRFERRHESTQLQTEHWTRRIAEMIAARAAVVELTARVDYLCRTGEGMLALRRALAAMGSQS